MTFPTSSALLTALTFLATWLTLSACGSDGEALETGGVEPSDGGSTGGSLAAGGTVAASGGASTGGTVAGSGGISGDGGGEAPLASGGSAGTASTDGGTAGSEGGTAGSGGTSGCSVSTLDLYLMIDVSGSTSNPIGSVTILDAIRDGVGQFARQPCETGLTVGLGYFGNHPIGSTSCNPADYQQPAEPFVGVPSGADAIANSLAEQDPTGETPTGAAIRGACVYARSEATANPSRSVAIVVITDGLPGAPVTSVAGICVPTLEDAAAAARECGSATPAVPVYVVAVGSNLAALSEISEAGGTGEAYFADGDAAADRIRDALEAIRIDAEMR